MDLLETLAGQGVIGKERIPSLRQEAGAGADGAKLEETLARAGVPVETVLKAKGDFYKVPTRTLGEDTIPFDVLRYVPEESARFYHFAPLGIADGALEIGITDPDNLEARDALNFISTRAGMPYKLFLLSDTDFAKLLEQYKGLSGEVGQALSEIETDVAAERAQSGGKPAAAAALDATEAEGTGTGADAPVTKIVGTIVRHAVEEGASDIHIEPLPDKTRVRFRVDGVLATNLTLPAKVHSSVITRIKVLSNMRLDEKRKPQDGRFSARVGGKKVDFRVSTFPTYWGEKIVMRILGMQAHEWSIDNIGLSARNLKLLHEAIKRPYGLILISGPTGSGKSTTLYSLLSQVDTEAKNVLSLEDPVEYTVPGVSQSQVRPEIGYTFANGLRTTLRQDPNVIMVGEIRDKETADLAVQAALTGHLVLSTIHTNDAVGIVPRLLDMGIDPYLIPPTLVLGIAQRLVRTLCPGGGEKFQVEGSMKELVEKEFVDIPKEYRTEIPSLEYLYRMKQTPECPSGTRGRTAVFEMFEMSPELEHAILARQSQDEMSAIVRKQGMITVRQDAIIKSAQGTVPFEEVGTLGIDIDIEGPAPAPVPQDATKLQEEGAAVELVPDAEGKTS
jgi:type IV pilus assembly protein PilB